MEKKEDYEFLEVELLGGSPTPYSYMDDQENGYYFQTQGVEPSSCLALDSAADWQSQRNPPHLANTNLTSVNSQPQVMALPLRTWTHVPDNGLSLPMSAPPLEGPAYPGFPGHRATKSTFNLNRAHTAPVSYQTPVSSTASSTYHHGPPAAAVSQPPSSKSENPPNGSFIAWLQVLGAGLLFINTWGSASSFGVFQTYFQQHLLSDYTPSEISWIGTIQIFLLVMGGVVSGPLYDMGYLQTLLGVGTFLTVLGYMSASFADSYAAAFLSIGVSIGLGAGCLFTPSLAVAASYFDTRMVGIAVGVASMGSSVGGVVYPVVFRAMTDSAGYSWACRTMGFISLSTLSVSLLIMRPRAGPKPRRLLIDRAALREPPFLLFTAAMFCFCVGIYVPFYYLPQFVQVRLGASEQTSFYLLAVQNGGGVLGRLVPGFVAARLGALPTLLGFSSAACVLAFSWTAVHDMAALIVLIVLYGNSSGAVMSLTAACIVAISPDKSTVGTRIGMTGAVYAFGLLIGNPIAGAILRTNAGFTGVSIFAGAMIITGLVLLSIGTIIHYGWRVRMRVQLERGGNKFRDIDVDSLQDVDEANYW